MRRTLLALLAAATVAAPAAPAADVRRDTVVVKITSPPQFFDSTPDCPEFRGVAQLTGLDGRPAGTGDLCVRAVEFPPNAFLERARLTLELRGGTIVAEVTLIDFFAPDGSATHVGWGFVVDGTGRYHDASGIFAAYGRITFDAEGNPSPDLTYVVRLR